MSKAQEARDEKARCIEQLREWLEPGDTVHTIIRHVARSGMSRHIGLVILSKNEDGGITDIHPNYTVAQACGYPLNKSGDGLVVGGCGMDMGFSVVYDLSRVLFPDGFKCSGERCGSNDHANRSQEGDCQYCGDPSVLVCCRDCRGKITHTGDGGYALNQRWL